MDSHEGKYRISDYSIRLKYYNGLAQDAEYLKDSDEIRILNEGYSIVRGVYEYYVRK